jgi:adenine-specific DNA methylase
VFEFLEHAEGDLLYLDPPYAGTSAYETSLRALDSIIEGRLVEPEPSDFSRRDALQTLERLFEAGRSFPVWVISYGNQAVGLDDLLALVGKFKKDVIADDVPFKHLTGLSSEAHKASNREFIIVGR